MMENYGKLVVMTDDMKAFMGVLLIGEVVCHIHTIETHNVIIKSLGEAYAESYKIGRYEIQSYWSLR